MPKSKKWILKEFFSEDVEKARALADELSVNEITALLLVSRGYETKEKAESFLNKKTEYLYNPFLLKDMDRAVERILSAVKNNEKITVYGDYDVDGVTSVSVLYMYLKGLGAEVDYYIPNRASEGYGVSIQAIDSLKESGTRLVITVDTGITATDEIEYMKTVGLDAVVTDHHKCQADIPKACAVVNPHREDDSYPFKELAGVGVVFKLVTALEFSVQEEKIFGDRGEGLSDSERARRLIESGRSNFLEKVCEDYIDLVALGTIADVMTLTDENRLICSAGLSKIENNPRVSIESLIDMATADRKNSKYPQKRKINASFIGFTVAPRINATGRIADARLGVELLTCNDREKADEMSRQLCELNTLRQEQENLIAEEVAALAESTHDFANDPVIVLAKEGWHHGIIGIVSSRLTEKYNLPSILISVEDGIGKGSGRSIKGFNIVEALKETEDVLERYGGHELAAGLTVSAEKIDEFRRRINEYARKHINIEDNEATLEIEFEVPKSALNVSVANELAMFEPCGTGNLQPVFLVREVRVVNSLAIGGGKHTKLTVETGSGEIAALVFGTPMHEVDYEAGDIVDIAFKLDVNDFQGKKSAQLLVVDAKISGEADYYKSECELLKKKESGESFCDTDGILPDRDDFAYVYRALKMAADKGEYVTLYRLDRIVKELGGDMRAAKLKLAMEILQDVGLVSVETLSTESLSGTEIYRITVPRTTEKINLFGTPRYKAMKKQLA